MFYLVHSRPMENERDKPRCMLVEIEWMPFVEPHMCVGSFDYLVCDIHGHVYIAYYDDGDRVFYPIYGCLGREFDDIKNVTHFAFLPENPNKKNSKPKACISNDKCIPVLIQKFHEAKKKWKKVLERKASQV